MAGMQALDSIVHGMYTTPMKHFHLLIPLSTLVWLRAEASRRGVGVCEVIRMVLQMEKDRQTGATRANEEGSKCPM